MCCYTDTFEQDLAQLCLRSEFFGFQCLLLLPMRMHLFKFTVTLSSREQSRKMQDNYMNMDNVTLIKMLWVICLVVKRISWRPACKCYQLFYEGQSPCDMLWYVCMSYLFECTTIFRKFMDGSKLVFVLTNGFTQNLFTTRLDDSLKAKRRHSRHYTIHQKYNLYIQKFLS